MSLLERSRACERGRGPDGVSTVPSTADFRSEVERVLSAERMIALVTQDPVRARAEVKSACRQVFSELKWAQIEAEDRILLENSLLDQIFGFGLIEGYLSDSSVTEIMINGTDGLFYEREGMLFAAPIHYSDEADIRALIDRVLGPLGRRVDESSPLVDARLPQGYRVNVAMPPVALRGPLVTVRKFPERVMTLADMGERGSVDADLAEFLRKAVGAKKSIAVTGGTGSGKTTLLNALSCCISPRERIVTVEDSAELRFFNHPHVVGLEARPRNTEGTGLVTIRDLVANALRMRPDRIIVGECRGSEALDMLQAMNTGHEGSLTTLHANSPEDSISRLTMMVRFGIDLPVDVIESSIATALDLIVHVKRSSDGRRFVSDVAALTFDLSDRRCFVKRLYNRSSFSQTGTWSAGAAGAAGRRESECDSMKGESL
ncbi:CpaF family protein [Gordonibacter sp. Marseille-P4307]|uniref:CpaF family protein n=1 Tax=Gordonibacter sp. Marseille-P4307 TaxID=2161815 RepID=UPI000F527ADC|nr:ATPase, T2SS/T4P/T4SS family [Gordonibacter sp. Marseille-P4307]